MSHIRATVSIYWLICVESSCDWSGADVWSDMLRPASQTNRREAEQELKPSETTDFMWSDRRVGTKTLPDFCSYHPFVSAPIGCDS